MASVRSINKKLDKAFDGKVTAQMDGDCLRLTGELEYWRQVVAAGMLAAGENPDANIVNEITCTAEKPQKPRRPRVKDSLLDREEPDVLIIGGGIIGCSVARELSRYKLSVLVVEKEHDLAMQATGHCTGLVHSGIGLRRGTMKYWYTRLGNQKFDKLCKELGVPFKRTGQYHVYTNPMRTLFLFLSLIYWWARGLQGVKIVNGEELRTKEPGISDGINAALYLPTGGVVCPHSLTIALAENSAQNGVYFSFNTMVQDINVEDGKITGVVTNRGTLRPKVVINAAGLFCEDIAEMADDKFYCVHPIKGTSVVLDNKFAGSLVGSAVSAHIEKAPRGKRRFSENLSSIVRTVHGSVLAGPLYMETLYKEDFSTDFYSVERVLTQSSRIIPSLDRNQAINCFSGVGAATYNGDFIIGSRRTVNGDSAANKEEIVSNLIHAAGISFPGLTASPAIAEDIAKMAVDMFGGERVVNKNPDFNPRREAPPVIRNMGPGLSEALIAENPDYGIIVCNCRQVTKGEIIESLNRNIKCDSIDGVRRRVRTGTGTCQGQCCSGAVLDIIASEKGITPQSVRKSGSGSELVFGNAGVASRRKDTSPYALRDEHESDTIIKAQLRALADNPQQTASAIRKDDVE